MTRRASPLLASHLVPWALTIALAACGSAPPHTPPAPAPEPPAPTPEPPAPTQDADDPYLWLEDVSGEASLAWVKAQNARSTGELEAVPGFGALRDRLRAIYESDARIPYVTKRGEHLYNLYTGPDHPRGIWRRTTLAEYRKAEPKWDDLLDVDALGKAENESWVFAGATCLRPAYERCLLALSRGGADATVVREFDVTTKAFVADGFVLPEAKTDVDWKDLDTLWVGTDFGPGSMTASGYPRLAKEWKRGTPLSAARTIFEAEISDVYVVAYRSYTHGRVRDLVLVGPTFFTNTVYRIEGDQLVRVDKPDDASLALWDDQVLVTLRSAWTVGGTTWPSGALLTMNVDDFFAGKRDGFTMLFTPRANASLASAEGLKSVIVVNELEDVHNVLAIWRRDKAGVWRRKAVPGEGLGSFTVSAWDDEESDDYWQIDDGFVAPTTLSLVRRGKKEALKRGPAFFDATGLEVHQHFATSADGTRVPYFQVARRGMSPDGARAVLIEGYGGFEVSLTPAYDATVGAAWLEKGGVYVVPNLRGGGEYGPAWHEAAVKEKRQRAYDDFAAVAEDLIARKVTRPERLGIIGGSNGGLLVGVMMTQRPELFGAVVCQAPLLDMKRYAQLLAGASWMGEYGDPSVPAEWAAIAKYSPYHNTRAGARYPRVLFTTSTRDDRVHPGHARKMMARMLEQQHAALFYENIEGGHGGAADAPQRANLSALAFAFLWRELNVDGGVSPAAAVGGGAGKTP